MPQSSPAPARAAIPAPPATIETVASPLLLPGKLRRDTTIADLPALYGAGNVRVGARHSWSARYR